MKKFLVLFLTPVSVLDKWMETPEAERKEMEGKMKVEWESWMAAHKDAIVETPSGAGKTQTVSTNGVADTRNDVMMYAVVQAESHDAASGMFVGHPHLQIPQATIEVMVINQMNM
jgi:predicted RecB family nuclease